MQVKHPLKESQEGEELGGSVSKSVIGSCARRTIPVYSHTCTACIGRGRSCLAWPRVWFY